MGIENIKYFSQIDLLINFNETSAYTIRKKLNKKITNFLED